MKKRILLICGVMLHGFLSAQNPLYIPPALTGPVFNLNVQTGTKQFYGTASTPTYGINGGWMAPTLIVNKGDSVVLNVTNQLPVRTTMHWHGLHVAPEHDGGPHQNINPNTTWSPSFVIRNNASTFWYHPHGAGQTDLQVSKGLAGFLIVKDTAEAALNLPRTYGVDDIPLNIQTKAFDNLTQIAIASDMDTAIFVNGTLDPTLSLPAQVIRFRLLNGSSLRTYNIGFSNDLPFYQIGVDGGLLDTPVALTRLRISPGERAEILLNLSGLSGQTALIKSFASELEAGIYGADSVGDSLNEIHDYDHNMLNGADFDLVKITITAANANPVTGIPVSLVPFTPFHPASATNTRAIVMDTIRLLPLDQPNLAEGPFGMNNQTFDMEVVNETVYLNTTEIWTLHNKTMVAHPFHIHDIQFNVIEKNGMPPAATERGWKDVVLVMPGDSVKFITKFETFSNPHIPYMYHCHLLHHEDDGMMGTFIVIDTMATGTPELSALAFQVYPNPVNHTLMIDLHHETDAEITITNIMGERVYAAKSIAQSNTIDVSFLSTGIYFIQVKSNDQLATRKFIKD